jgi:hypothetical protein
MHASQASPPNATVPFAQYSVAHCDWHIPLGPHAHAVMSIRRVRMPAVCASWQHLLHATAVDIAAHIPSVCPAFPPLLPELLPLPEPLGLPELPPLVLPLLLPLMPPVLPLEVPAVPPEPLPLPLLVTGELPLLGLLEEQPLA